MNDNTEEVMEANEPIALQIKNNQTQNDENELQINNHKDSSESMHSQSGRDTISIVNLFIDIVIILCLIVSSIFLSTSHGIIVMVVSVIAFVLSLKIFCKCYISSSITSIEHNQKTLNIYDVDNSVTLFRLYILYVAMSNCAFGLINGFAIIQDAEYNALSFTILMFGTWISIVTEILDSFIRKHFKSWCWGCELVAMILAIIQECLGIYLVNTYSYNPSWISFAMYLIESLLLVLGSVYSVVLLYNKLS
eukprot:126038_1